MNFLDNYNKKYLMCVMLAGFFALIVFGFSMFIIWKRPLDSQNTKVTSESELGSFVYSKLGMDDQIKSYYSDITHAISEENYTKLYKLLNPEYVKCYSLTEEKFTEYLKCKNLKGNELSLLEYKNTTFENKNIFKITISASGDSASSKFDVIVFEESPNNYTISFDDFCGYIEEEKKYEDEGLSVSLIGQKYFSNEYRANITIKNVSDSNIILNNGKASEIIYLFQGDAISTKVSNNIFLGKTIVLKPNETINYPIRFLLSDFTFNTITKIVINDVTNEKINNTKSITLNIKK